MSTAQSAAARAGQRRSHGAGSLLLQARADGQQVWYGRWHASGRRLNRRIGLKRRRGNDRGLTRTEAEAELRRMIAIERPPPPEASVPFSAAEHMLDHLQVLERKHTTLENYRSILRAQLIPSFGNVMVHRITAEQVEALAAQMLREGKAARTRASALKLLSQVISFAQRKAGAATILARRWGSPRCARVPISASLTAASLRLC